jgi:nitrite reductase/ring-hydroxylating ferredoxin subunit
MMNDFVNVAHVREILPGTGRTVEINGIWIAVFNVEGTFYAIDNACPHAGGPLGEGKLHGTVVECPWHGWKFSVVNGQRVGNPNFEVPCCQVRVENGQIQIALPSGLTP